MDWIRKLLKTLNDHEVPFVVIGGVASIFHGSVLATYDLDVCAPLDDERTMANILAALKDVHPKWRMHPDKPPFEGDPAKWRGVKNLYLTTDIGQIDILGELPGVGTFDDIVDKTVESDLGGVHARILDLTTLIAAKRIAGREKDRRHLIELEITRQNLAEKISSTDSEKPSRKTTGSRRKNPT